MAPNFSKNAILEGTVDYFCLVCESYLMTERDTENHIAETVHKKNLSAVQYVEELKTDKIKKIKHGYFCEFCNKLLTVLTRVRLHVAEPMHNDKKYKNLFKRVGDCIVALGNVVISDQSWNGLIENSCTVCNTEYDDKEMHKQEPTHILNVMQKKVVVDKNRNIYRMIDECSFQCLTCHTILISNINTIKSHFDDSEHKHLYQACCDAYQSIKLQVEETCTTKVITNIEEHLKSKDINERRNKFHDDDLESKQNEVKSLHSSLTKSQKNETNVIKEGQLTEVNEQQSTNKTTKQKEQTSNIIPKNTNDEKGNKLTQTKFDWDEKCEERICKVLGAKDYITCDPEGKMYCLICEWPIESLSHINEKHHQTIMKMHKNRLEKNKTSSKCNISCNNTKEKDTTQILESLDEFQKNGINVNFETNTALCKKCITNVEFNYEAIKIHISEHNNKPAKKNKKAKPFKAGDDKVTDKKNSLFTKPVFLNHPNSELKPKSEKLETKGLENSKKDMLNSPENSDKTSSNVEHSLKTDQGFALKIDKSKEAGKELESASIKPNKSMPKDVKKIPLVHFINSIIDIEYFMFHDAIINNKISINICSFHFMNSTESDMLKCYLCDVYTQCNELGAHVCEPKHIIQFMQTEVIIYEDSEFIRQVICGHFHCGYCNLIVSSWDNMEIHLKLGSHAENKSAAMWRLERYLSELENHPSQKRKAESILNFWKQF